MTGSFQGGGKKSMKILIALHVHRSDWFQQSHRALSCGKRVGSSCRTRALFGRSGSRSIAKVTNYPVSPGYSFTDGLFSGVLQRPPA